MNMFPRGSQWRKWDLHIHPPGTTLGNNYGSPPDWDRFCRVLDDSDVQAFGITDYFSLDAFVACREEFSKRMPQSRKILFPNLELRLNESVNRADESVNLHLLFRPDLPERDAQRLLAELKTEISDRGGRRLSCIDLATKDQYEQATVTRASVAAALEATFGSKAAREDSVILLVPARGDGIRTAQGERRKANLTDVIDDLTDAIFGRVSDQPHFLKRDRYEDTSKESAPKPVFSGSDAHGFEDLELLLGQTVDTGDHHSAVTWIKADLTWEGLQQTLVEPEERVRIQPTQPDPKEPYKVISKVRFEGNDFPAEVEFNPNLVSVIGSRSSGKSALLAYIAHAIDPEYTITQQVAASPGASADDVGPAAGKTWEDVAHISCSVEWADQTATTGKVIYIPQNSLFSISERPGEVARKIEPALFRLSDEYRLATAEAARITDEANAAISSAVDDWFRARKDLKAARKRLQDLGDKAAVTSTRDELAEQIAELRAKSSLTEDEVTTYESAQARLRAIEREVGALDHEHEVISPYVASAVDAPAGAHGPRIVEVEIAVIPSWDDLEEPLKGVIAGLVASARGELLSAISEALTSRVADIAARRGALATERHQLNEKHSALFEKHQGLRDVDALVARHAAQLETLADIEAVEALATAHTSDQEAAISRIESGIAERSTASVPLIGAFERAPTELDGMTFGFEEEIEDTALERVSDRFNRQERSRYLTRDARVLDVEKVLHAPAEFLEALAAGSQKLKQNVLVVDAAQSVLGLSPSQRFFAVLDGDRIGGFARSSMTPGKQALFALTLTLSESDEPWPLLIDQPEDDLDSRSIYETIVPYVKARKRERQILMVTHDANLAIGADSEQVVVANRHGLDRQNEAGRTFDYATGSLEYSKAKSKQEPIVLRSCGIREHACEVLDGGAEAFQKRRDKYRI